MERQTKLIRREPHPSLFCKEELKRIGRLEEERREDRGREEEEEEEEIIASTPVGAYIQFTMLRAEKEGSR